MTYKYHGEPKTITHDCIECNYLMHSLPQWLIDRFPEGHYRVSEHGWCIWGSTVKVLDLDAKYSYRVCILKSKTPPWNSIGRESHWNKANE